MSVEEFKKKARELGLSDEYIKEVLEGYEENKKIGIKTNLELFLIEPQEE